MVHDGIGRRQLVARLRRHWLLALLLVSAAIGIALLDSLVDEPLRRWAEREANARVTGYTIHMRRADVHPWRLAVDVFDVDVRQDAHPARSVAHIGRLAANVDWRALLRARLVADLLVVNPEIHIDTDQLSEEWNDQVPLKDRGWQHLWEIYPLKVNNLRLVNGTIDYTDSKSQRSLDLKRLEVNATNIRHVTGAVLMYPSPIRAEANLFGTGRLALQGYANFLLRPHAGLNVVAEVKGLPLAALGPIAADYRIKLSGGSLSARGQFEVAPDRYIANLKNLDVEDLNVDYVSGEETPQIARARRGIEEAVRYADQSPSLRLRAQSLNVTGTMGYVSATQPPYRLLLTGARLDIRNFSNRAAQGESPFAIDGLFMDSGKTHIRGVLRPGPGPTNFALTAEVVETELPRLNDLLRAHGRFDVSAGKLSVYSQLVVREGQVRGYVKPLFRDVDVYDATDDRDKAFFRKLYEKIVEGIANILTNRPREEVATVVDISGPLKDPRTSTLQVIGNLLRNAFVSAILPGFDIERQRKHKGDSPQSVAERPPAE